MAAGALAKALLAEAGIAVGSFVTSVGWVEASWSGDLALLHDRAEQGRLRMPDPAADQAAVEAVDRARDRGDTLGGTFVCFATGVPVGLGSHAVWTARLDARLGLAFLSVPAIKGIEVGLGFGGAREPGSRVHDEILPGGAGDGRRGGVRRETNRAGGIEGGITNGEDLWVRAAMKPIPTLRTPLRSVELDTKEPVQAAYERSDVCAVRAAAVIGEAMTALVLAGAFLEKFAGDSLAETKRNHGSYMEYLSTSCSGPVPAKPSPGCRRTVMGRRISIFLQESLSAAKMSGLSIRTGQWR